MNQSITGRNGTIPVYSLPTETLVMMSIFLATLLLTLITNVITIFLIVKTPSLRSTTNMFILSLSASDVLYAFFMLILTTIIISQAFLKYKINIVIMQYFIYFAWGILIHSSIANLALVSIERWVYILHPFWYQRHVTVKVVVVCIVITWASAMIVNLPYLFSQFASKRVSYFTTCHGYVYPVLHTACCLLLLVIYTHIAVTTFRQLTKISKLKPQQDNTPDGGPIVRDSRRSFQIENWKAIKLIIIICGLYFLFVSPYVYFFSISQLRKDLMPQSTSWNFLMLILLSIYHCSNFFVYALRTRQFRRALHKNFICCRSSRVASWNTVHRATTVFELQSHIQKWEQTDDVSLH